MYTGHEPTVDGYQFVATHFFSHEHCHTLDSFSYVHDLGSLNIYRHPQSFLILKSKSLLSKGHEPESIVPNFDYSCYLTFFHEDYYITLDTFSNKD